VNINAVNSKSIRHSDRRPKQNGDFLENASDDFDSNSVMYRQHRFRLSSKAVSSGKQRYALRAQILTFHVHVLACIISGEQGSADSN
jgi:hypothetical protein